MTSALLPVVGRCKCPHRSDKLPLRIVEEAARVLRLCQLPPNQPVQTYFCGTCKGIVVLTAKDLHLVA